jgi:alanine racemase
MLKESSLEAKPRAWVEVDLGALVRNARALERRARNRLLPMIKADAYGLGALPVARALEALDPVGYGVSSIAEGSELRRGGITRPILIFTPTLEADLERLLAAGLTPTLASPEGITAWRALGGGDWHLAIDTGMHRAGVPWNAVGSLMDALRAAPPVGAFTHFHSAELDNGTLEAQEGRFRAALDALPARPRILHTENSAAIVRRSPSPWDWVRPGVFLYGVGSGPRAAIQPETVAHLHAQLIEVRDVAAGEGVSYDATWTAQAARRVATVSVGYADGYRRQLGNVGRAIVGGSVVPVVGVVTMDMLMVDVTGIECAIGDRVTLLGRSGTHVISAESAAEAADLSPYELLTGLRQRLVRTYVGAE